MIKKDSIDKLIDIIQIEDVVGDYVNLKRRGANYIGLCPFHDEKTPSFSVSATKGIYKCFGCGEAGNAIGFVMANEQLGFVDAVRLIAEKYNFELEETEDTAEEKKQRDEKESMYIVTSFAQKYYSNNLFHSEIGRTVGLSYFKKRGFTKKTIETFGLGFAYDEYQHLIETAKKKKYDIELLKKTGLVSEKNDRLYDFFRDRVMFPIHNVTGKVIAFAGRTLKADKKIPKYVNSAETDIYSKSYVLYGMYQAKKAINKEDNCYLVEGYTDVISLHQSGVQNVVASSGTSLTQGQIKLIKRYTQNITLLFDGDQAGIKAALRGVDMILPEDVNVRVVPLPKEHDPDSFIQEKGYKEFVEYANKNTVDFIIFKLKTLLGENSNNDPIKKAEATREIVQSIALVPDSIKRSFYVKECSDLLAIEEQILHIEVNKAIRNRLTKNQQFTKQDNELTTKLEEAGLQKKSQQDQRKLLDEKGHYVEREVLRLFLEYSDLEWEEGINVQDYLLFELSDQEFNNTEYQTLLELYKQASIKNEVLLQEGLLANNDVMKTVIDIVNSPYELSENWFKKHEIRITKPKEEIYHNDISCVMSSFTLFRAQIQLEQRQQELKNLADLDEQFKALEEIKHLKDIIVKANKELNRNYYLH